MRETPLDHKLNAGLIRLLTLGSLVSFGQHFTEERLLHLALIRECSRLIQLEGKRLLRLFLTFVNSK